MSRIPNPCLAVFLLAAADGYDVDYLRVPVTDEKAPKVCQYQYSSARVRRCQEPAQIGVGVCGLHVCWWGWVRAVLCCGLPCNCGSALPVLSDGWMVRRMVVFCRVLRCVGILATMTR